MSEIEVPTIEQSSNGYAPVKPEYIKPRQARDKLNLNFVSDSDKKKVTESQNVDQASDEQDDNSAKRTANENDDDDYKSKRAKRLHGMNKNRNGLNNQNIRDGNADIKLCSKFAGSFGLQEYGENIEQCAREDCKFSHDVEAFMQSSPVYLDEPCYMFDKYGFCGFGHRCKFGKSHLDLGGTNHNLLDKEKFFANGPNLEKSYGNILTNDLKLKLRKKQYDFSALEEKLGPASIDEREWKRIDFRDKLILAPLTTVGR